MVDAIVNEPGQGSLTVIDAHGVVTGSNWTAVHRRARQLAAVLNGYGLGPGCRVGLLADTSVDLVATVQAVWLAGGAIAMLPLPAVRNRRAFPARTHAMITDAGLDLVVVGDPVPTVDPVPTGTAVVRLDELTEVAAGRAPATPHLPDPDDLAILQYTSGSTRVPRGVPVRHAHLAANLAAIRQAMEHSSDHPGPMLSWLPLYHDLGLIGSLALPMACGCPVVLLSPVAFAGRPAIWLDAMTRYRPTASAAPNYGFALLTRLLRGQPDADLSSLRCLLSGGEPVSPHTMRAFLDAARPYGLDPSVVMPAYGLAEATLAVTLSPRGRGMRVDDVDPVALELLDRAVRPAATGLSRGLVRLGAPVPGVSVRIVDRRTSAQVGDRRVGHIEISGPSVVGHYLGDPQPPPGTWLRTGDLGYLADGELIVCGREKDVLIAAGRNIYPQDIEAAAQEVPEVRPGGVATFGIPAESGDRVVVVIESRTSRPQEIRQAVMSAVLREVGIAAEVAVLAPGQLPKTSSGKLRRAEARRQYLCGELSHSGTERRSHDRHQR